MTEFEDWAKSDPNFDFSLKGKRIKLLLTNDEFTKLKSGDLGTIKYKYKNLDSWNLVVIWDTGSNLDMIEGVDQYEILEDSEN